MRWIWLMVLSSLAFTGVAQAGSLEDDIKYGASREFSINRSIPAVRFDRSPSPPFQLEGDVAGVWIRQWDEKAMLGGAFNHKPVVHLEFKNGKSMHCVVRFELGCMFVSQGKKEPVLLDWQAVKGWEKAGGFAKKGIPRTSLFRARVNIVTPRKEHATL